MVCIRRWAKSIHQEFRSILPEYSVSTAYRIRKERSDCMLGVGLSVDKRYVAVLDPSVRDEISAALNIALIVGDLEYRDLVNDIVAIAKWARRFVDTTPVP